jgi:prolipoprotein diacylglyceryl transferase
MRRVLFSWRGFNFYSYPTMLYVGSVCGVFVAAHLARSSGLDPDRFALAMVILFMLAVLGARLFFVLSHWPLYRKDPSRIWRRSEGGMAMYGGILVAVPLSVPLLRALDLPFALFWDAATFAILIGMAFTRIGCLLNGCCSGRPTDSWFALHLPDHRGIWRRRVPMQLLEAAWALLLLAVALVIRRWQPAAGAIFGSTVVAYATGRCFLQKLRDDETVSDTGVIQATSIVLASAALIGLCIGWAW